MTQQKTKSEKLKTFLEGAYRKTLSDDDVAEYKERLVSFFGLLFEIDQKNKRKK